MTNKARNILALLVAIVGMLPAKAAQQRPYVEQMPDAQQVPTLDGARLVGAGEEMAEPLTFAEWQDFTVAPELSGRDAKTIVLPSSGLWYQKPQGTFYNTSSQLTSGTKFVNVVVPMFIGLYWRNKYVNPTDVIWFSDASSNLNATNMTSSGDYLGRYLKPQKGYSYLMPKMKLATDTFYLGAKVNARARVKTTDEIVAVTQVDLNGGYINRFGSTQSGFTNPFGTYTGTDSDTGKKYVTHAITEYYRSPIRSMMVDSIWFDFISFSGTALSSTAKMTLSIHKWDGTDKKIFSTTFGASAISNVKQASGYTTGRIKVPTLVADVFGDLFPIVINGPFYITIEGFDQTGVDFSLYSCRVGPYQNNVTGYDYYPYGGNSGVQPTRLIHNYTDGTNFRTAYVYTTSNQNQFNAVIWLSMMFDVATHVTGFDVMTAPDEGGLIYAEIDGKQYEYIQIYTTYPWSDEDGNENYYFDDMPEWLQLEDVNEDYFESNSFVNVKIIADPLPANIAYREATFHIVSDRGASGALKVVQGTPKPIELLGDVNGDGAVNSGDVSAIYNVILGVETDTDVIRRSDVNGDGTVNAGDVSTEFELISTNNN